MQGIQACGHVPAVLLVLLLVASRHQRPVLPICGIEFSLETASIEDEPVTGLSQEILLILDIFGDGIVP